jgi:hypothetical protein
MNEYDNYRRQTLARFLARLDKTKNFLTCLDRMKNFKCQNYTKNLNNLVRIWKHQIRSIYLEKNEIKLDPKILDEICKLK